MKRLALLMCVLGLAQAMSGAKLVPPVGRNLRVAVVMTDGATMIDFAGPWEVFQDANTEDHQGFDLYTVGASAELVQTSGGMKVRPDYTFDNAPVPDIVVVGAQRGAPGLREWLKAMRGKAQVVMSVCTGAFKLADAGLLDGKEATTHHDFYDSFEKAFPKVKLQRSRRWVQSDEGLFTAGGLSSGIDLALHIVQLYFGTETAVQTAAYMEYRGDGWRSPATGGQAK